jgi:hypothetical protein
MVVGILLWQILGTWRRSLDGQRPVAQQNPSEEKSLPFGLSPQLQVGKQYANTIADKDLFVPSRGRTQVEAKPVATVPPPSHLKLVGVVLNRGKEEALFADSSQGGKVVRVRKGEVLGSYKADRACPATGHADHGTRRRRSQFAALVSEACSRQGRRRV